MVDVTEGAPPEGFPATLRRSNRNVAFSPGRFALLRNMTLGRSAPHRDEQPLRFAQAPRRAGSALGGQVALRFREAADRDCWTV